MPFSNKNKYATILVQACALVQCSVDRSIAKRRVTTGVLMSSWKETSPFYISREKPYSRISSLLGERDLLGLSNRSPFPCVVVPPMPVADAGRKFRGGQKDYMRAIIF